MRRAALYAAAALAVIADAAAERALTPQEQAIFANLVAEEFTAVCIRTDARQKALEVIASRRGWRPRPVEITGSYRLPSKAWEGDVRHLSYARGVERKSLSFVAAVTDEDSPTGRHCELLSDELAFAPLRDALQNQGYNLKRDESWGGEGRYEHRYATFCSSRLAAEERKHDIIVQWRIVPERPAYSGARLVFVRDSSVSGTICPQTISLCGDLPEAEYPRIEPWLGQKPDGLPEPVESKPEIDGE